MSEKDIGFQFDGGSFSVMFVEVEDRPDDETVLTKIKTEFHPTGLKKFLKWCDDDWDEERFEWNVENLSEEEIRMFVNRVETTIVPEKNVVYLTNSGLHYVCQHCFDIIPEEPRQKFYEDYPVLPDQEILNIGYLYTLDGEKLLVKSSDIIRGFLLTMEEVEKVGSFSDWIKLRRNPDKGSPAERAPRGV